MRTMLTLVAVAALAVTPLGCTPAQQEPQTVDYSFGTMSSLVEAPLTAVHTAAGQTLIDLNMVSTRDTINTQEGEAVVVGKNAAGQRVRIEVYAKTDTSSLVTIRVGTLGARDLSTAVLQRIKANL